MERIGRFVRHGPRMRLGNVKAPQINQTGRVAIVAGNGELPAHLYASLKDNNENPVLIGIDREIDSALSKDADAVLTFGQVGKLFKILEAEKVKRVVFAGGVKNRPDFKNLKLDLLTVKELPSLLKIVMGGDNSVLAKISKYFEGKDITIVGSHEIAPELITPDGLVCGKFNKRSAMPIIRQGFEAAKTIGGLDVGQAVVTEDGRTVALEGVEGTDAMLQRVADLRVIGRLSKTPKFGVLVKTLKPKQDMRADLPAIGPDTIKSVAAAGLKGIVIEAGASLILRREETLQLAKQHNIFILGYRAERKEGKD